MGSYASSPREGPFVALVKVARRMREARERRLLRELQERAGDIEWAHIAPTVQDWIDGRTDSLSR
jgi:hypothetical protein